MLLFFNCYILNFNDHNIRTHKVTYITCKRLLVLIKNNHFYLQESLEKKKFEVGYCPSVTLLPKMKVPTSPRLEEAAPLLHPQ